MGEFKSEGEKRIHWGPISIDELNPVFDHQEGTVTITSDHFSKAIRKGTMLTVASNEHLDKRAEGEVIAVDSINKTLKIKLLD